MGSTAVVDVNLPTTMTPAFPFPLVQLTVTEVPEVLLEKAVIAACVEGGEQAVVTALDEPGIK